MSENPFFRGGQASQHLADMRVDHQSGLRHNMLRGGGVDDEVDDFPVASPVGNTQAKRIAFMSGNDDFRAARLRCALACQGYNKLTEDASIEDRVTGWLDIIDPDSKTKRDTNASPAVHFSAIFKRASTKPEANDSSAVHTPPVTPVSGSPAPRPTIPYIKQPVYLDYGLRVHIAPTTFINRNCTFLDTPVADIIIGEYCSFGPSVTIISVGHPVQFEERCESKSNKPGSWGARVVIGDGVWIGAGVTVLPGVTIGSYSTIGAGSVVTKDIPPRCVAMGNPAKVRHFIDSDGAGEPLVINEQAHTLEDALKKGRED
ncbi:hypothetical protein Daus18300_008144 [Diaporthe australafricana]|uniref:Mannose-1-phosphate guanylyltransferase n=1 Tax=Diaporthe australafricana TaxID=127596 RepID=A0ABR3WJS1_9PEZI